ncbi:MAG TPA: hypothetical protein DD614_02730 [Clostridiales bacterium]|nr:hypothetical protein [Clostridiales bacterium]
MYKISDIISTPVISLYEGEHIGIIYNIMFDYRQKKCNFACILNENDNIPRLIKFKDIFKIGNDCIFIKNLTCLDLETNCEKEMEENTNPINLKVYNLSCEFLGTSHDIIVDDNFRISQIVLNNGKIIERNDILNIGKSTIIVGSDVSIQKFKPVVKSIKIQNSPKKVMILSDFINSETNTQNKIITDFRFLIGRILSQDVIALNGEMIARKDSIVTKDIVNKASSYGKLVEIARYSKA